MLSGHPDGTGIEHIEILKKTGYDYVELPLAQIMQLPADAFKNLLKKLGAAGLKCEACNNFFPANIRLTGNEMNTGSILSYAAASLEKAALLGVEVIVFGSSQARNVPEGFPREKAWRQLKDILRIIGEMAGPMNIFIAIEPLNRSESNIVTTVSEGFALAKEVRRNNVRLLVDYYHIAVEKDSLDDVKNAGNFIRHVHFSRPEGRTFPTIAELTDYAGFFRTLKEAGYDGRISVEAYSKNTEKYMRDSLELLRYFNDSSVLSPDNHRNRST